MMIKFKQTDNAHYLIYDIYSGELVVQIDSKSLSEDLEVNYRQKFSECGVISKKHQSFVSNVKA